MNRNINRDIILSAAVALALSTQANAAGTYFDARNDAMGGVGVASSKYSVAPVANPALLSKHENNDNLSIVLPSIGLQVTDKDKIVDSFDDISKSYDDTFRSALKFALDKIQNGTERFEGDDLSKDAAQLKKNLEDAKGNTADVNVGVNLIVAMPNKYFDAAFVANAYGTVSISAEVSQRDLDSLDIVVKGDDIIDIHRLESEARAVAALVQDYGVSLAKAYDVKGYPLYVGVTPKIQKIDTFNYSVPIEKFNKDDIDAREFRDSDTGFNADLGAAIDAHNLTYAFSVKNLVSRDIETKVMNEKSYTYKVSPLVTAGVAYRGKLATLAADVDLTETKGYTHIKSSQYAGVGAEFDAWKWAQLRVGYRADLKSERPNLATAGIGLSPFDLVHLDIAGMVGSDKSAGAVVSMSYTF